MLSLIDFPVAWICGTIARYVLLAIRFAPEFLTQRPAPGLSWLTMVDRVNQLLSLLDWEKFAEITLLGGIGDLLHVVKNASRKAQLKKLATCTGFNKRLEVMVLSEPSLYVYVALSFSRRVKGTLPLTLLKVFDFLNSFFKPEISDAEMKTFIKENVSIVVVRRHYYQKKGLLIKLLVSLPFPDSTLDNRLILRTWQCQTENRNCLP